MHKPVEYKELHDPFAHYTRGILYFNKETFTFTAYRMPYLELDKKTWRTEQAFMVDYQQIIARKYNGCYQPYGG